MSSSSAPEMAARPSSDTTVIDLMGSLLDLDSHQFSELKGSLASDLRLQRYRLLSLLFSPTHFSYVLSYLRSLSLYEKTTLLARLLIRTLHHFAIAIEPQTSKSPKAKAIALRDLDAAVLLMAMCESYDDNEEEEDDVRLSDDEWRDKIMSHLLCATLSPLGLGLGATFGRSIGIVGKCRRFFAAVCGEEKGKREVGAAITAVVSLESVRCGYQWKENCAICREELEEWRDVCEMPCKHRFHWGCILPWLRQRNTCPCCRFELPSDDVFCEIGRLWRVVTDATRKKKNQDPTNNH